MPYTQADISTVPHDDLRDMESDISRNMVTLEQQAVHVSEPPSELIGNSSSYMSSNPGGPMGPERYNTLAEYFSVIMEETNDLNNAPTPAPPQHLLDNPDGRPSPNVPIATDQTGNGALMPPMPLPPLPAPIESGASTLQAIPYPHLTSLNGMNQPPQGHHHHQAQPPPLPQPPPPPPYPIETAPQYVQYEHPTASGYMQPQCNYCMANEREMGLLRQMLEERERSVRYLEESLTAALRTIDSFSARTTATGCGLRRRSRSPTPRHAPPVVASKNPPPIVNEGASTSAGATQVTTTSAPNTGGTGPGAGGGGKKLGRQCALCGKYYNINNHNMLRHFRAAHSNYMGGTTREYPLYPQHFFFRSMVPLTRCPMEHRPPLENLVGVAGVSWRWLGTTPPTGSGSAPTSAPTNTIASGAEDDSD